MNPDKELTEFIEAENIQIFGVENTRGFENAQPGWHPNELMPKCKSVIVFGRPYIEHPLHIEEKTHLANRSWWDINQFVKGQISN